MKKFTSEFEIGEIYRRDKWQFELKSEFFPSPKLKKNIYKQEIYFFIPNALQINNENYSMKQFYHDQTNLIRYKTPEFTFQELLDNNNSLSPMVRITEASHRSAITKNDIDFIEEELKLLGNIVRSLLRKRVGEILKSINNTDEVYEAIKKLCSDIYELRAAFTKLELELKHIEGHSTLLTHFYYTGEFITNTTQFYLTGLLDKVKSIEFNRSHEIEKMLSDQLIQESNDDDLALLKSDSKTKREEEREFVFYKRWLLNKFFLDALLLHTSRKMLYKRYSNVIAAISAGIAMLFFFILFVWQGNVFIINSMPFIVITVLLYIVKDRIKEGIKNLSYQNFHRWFPNFTTEIHSPDGKYDLGRIEESYSFIEEKNLPQEIVRIRHREFHAVLEEIKRPEWVLYFKKKICLWHPPKGIDERRNALSIIFRFNISHFIEKADSPFFTHLKLDPKTNSIVKQRLPKVYHLNIILKNTYVDEALNTKEEFKKFRLILDQNGIKRLEQLKANGTNLNIHPTN
jgi:hypothetical protein